MRRQPTPEELACQAADKIRVHRIQHLSNVGDQLDKTKAAVEAEINLLRLELDLNIRKKPRR